MQNRCFFGSPRAGTTVLVTGAAGFIGSALVARLVATGARVVAVDDLSAGQSSALPPRSRNFSFRQLSVLDGSALSDAARDADLVFHLAGVVGMKAVEADPDRALRVSDEGTRNLLAATPGVPLVLFSSSCVYGLTGAGRASEADSLSLAGCLRYDGGRAGYAVGKLRLEEQGLVARTHGRSIMILRPFNVVGPGQSGRHGMVLPRLMAAAQRGEPLLVYDNGLQTRSFSALSTFLDCVMALVASRTAWEAESSTINIGTPTSSTILALAETICALTRSDSEIHMVPFSSVYPGRMDVPHRAPCVGRLESLVGPVSWPGLPEIVLDVIGAWRDPAENSGIAARGSGS